MTAVALLAGVGGQASASVASVVVAATTGAPAGGVWGNAETVPGFKALSAMGASVTSISCASAGECSAGGFYADQNRRDQSFVVSEINGVWGKAAEVPGSGPLNAGGDGQVNSVSCAAPGDCSAVGSYRDGSGRFQAFVASQANGVWGQALEIPGGGPLNVGGNAQGVSVSCGSPENCSAGGEYSDGSGDGQAFVVSEVNGVWGQAAQVPGSGTLNGGGNATILSMSCPSAGNCSASGFYLDSSDHNQAFVVSEVNGAWGNAAEVPGSDTLNVGSAAFAPAISCATPGNCSAGGNYTDGSGNSQVFVVNQVNGVWGQAAEVPGSDTLNADGHAGISSMSCTAPGDCSAGGSYRDGAGGNQAFVVNEANGVWGQAAEVPGSGTLNVGGEASVESLSCTAPGTCSASGSYLDSADHSQAFVVDAVSGVWGQAEEIPGSGTLNVGGSAFAETISCAAPGNCSAGGLYLDAMGIVQAFVANETESSTALAVSSAKVAFGQPNPVKLSVTITPAWASGKVTVTAQPAAGAPISLCAITATAGQGTCDLPGSLLNAGRYQLVAVYKGTKILPGSTSPAKPLTIAAAKSTTALTLSAATISHKHETAEKFTVLVSGQFTGAPVGRLTIAAKSAKRKAVQVCQITLAPGTNTCHLAAKALAPGSYQVTATYAGSTDFRPSTSAKETLKVTK
jgi:hypothetical protein